MTVPKTVALFALIGFIIFLILDNTHLMAANGFMLLGAIILGDK